MAVKNYLEDICPHCKKQLNQDDEIYCKMPSQRPGEMPKMEGVRIYHFTCYIASHSTQEQVDNTNIQQVQETTTA